MAAVLLLVSGSKPTSADEPRDFNGRVIYPLEAIARQWEGVTQLRVSVQRDGSIDSIKVEKTSSHKILDDAAVGSVYQWTFQSPPNDKPVVYIIPIQFTITPDTSHELNASRIKFEPGKGRPDLSGAAFKPLYPPQAWRRGLDGDAALTLSVSEDGFVTGVTVTKSTGHPILDWSAVASVYRWAFENPTRDGKPQAFELEVPMHFAKPTR